MGQFKSGILRTLFLAACLIPGHALACKPAQDGCLGCSDDELQACLTAFTEEICRASGNPENCDARRVYDDAERYVLISTGSHMSRIRAMMRSARKYNQ
ncbi:MAG: hypothetical protein R3308_09325, partial [Thiohalobacterales bacterium]|nr:hypothetical protein [Thiohalobacterales bacterium]